MNQGTKRKRKVTKSKAVRYTTITLLLAMLIAYVMQLGPEQAMESKDLKTARHESVAIFGATGRVGDGVLKAVMSDPDVNNIYVITRRVSERIQTGIDSGRIIVLKHMDYLDYSSIMNSIKTVDAVFWALGTSAGNVSKEQYVVIHVDFPMAFLEQWLGSGESKEASFHYVSGAGAGEDSMMHWAREKARAERELSTRAEVTRLKVISYRPPLVIPTTEQANISHTFLNTVFSPVKMATRANLIGEAMLEISARGDELANGAIIESRGIHAYSNAYLDRLQITGN